MFLRTLDSINENTDVKDFWSRCANAAHQIQRGRHLCLFNQFYGFEKLRVLLSTGSQSPVKVLTAYQ